MIGADALVLVSSLAILLFLGVPIVYAIGLATVATMLLSMPLQPALTTVAQQMAVGIDSFVLVAIPFFILAGQLMNRGGIARRLVDFAQALVGGWRGGLAHVNILAAMLFGSISGSAVAAASAIGSTLAEPMEREGYDRGFAAAVNIAAAPTGLLIPPSNVLIVYSLASGGVSIAALFVAGYLPGILLGLVLMATVSFLLRHQPKAKSAPLPDGELGRRFLRALPSLALFFVVIVGSVAGIFTPTEGAAIAVICALILALAYREMKLGDLPEALRQAALTTGVVMSLIGASMAMAWVLSFARLPQTISSALLELSDNRIIVLLIINLVLLAVGTFLDMTPAVLIFTPIFLPVATKLGIDPVHFGLILVFNLCIGLCTPPVGSVLFVGAGVAQVSIGRVARALLPFFLAMIATLLVVTFVPALSLWLPRLLGL